MSKNSDLTSEEARLKLILFLRKIESDFFEKQKEENKMWWTILYYQDRSNKAVQAESKKHAHILGQKAKDNNKNIVSFSVDFS